MFSIVNFSRLHIHIRAHQSLIILGHSGILSILYYGPKPCISINEADWRFLLFSRTGMMNIVWFKSTSQQWEGDHKKTHLVSVVIESDVFPFMMIFINCTVNSMFGTTTIKTWLCFAYWQGLIQCTDKVTQTFFYHRSWRCGCSLCAHWSWISGHLMNARPVFTLLFASFWSQPIPESNIRPS